MPMRQNFKCSQTILKLSCLHGWSATASWRQLTTVTPSLRFKVGLPRYTSYADSTWLIELAATNLPIAEAPGYLRHPFFNWRVKFSLTTITNACIKIMYIRQVLGESLLICIALDCFIWLPGHCRTLTMPKRALIGTPSLFGFCPEVIHSGSVTNTDAVRERHTTIFIQFLQSTKNQHIINVQSALQSQSQLQAICTIASFYYYDQNPLRFSFHI